MKKLAALAALLTVCNYGFAQAVVAPDAFERFMSLSTGAGKQTVSFGTNGTPVMSPGVPTLSPAADGVRATATGSISNPSGNPLAVTATGRVPAAAVAKSLATFALKIAGPLTVGIALWDLAKELGYDLSRDTSGAVVVKKADPASCSVAPCYVYQGRNNGVWYPSLLDAATNSVGIKPPGCTGFSVYEARLIGVKTSLPSNMHFQYDYCGSSNLTFGETVEALSRTTVAPSPPTLLPSTLTEFENAIAAKSGWPTTSKVAQALVDSRSGVSEKLATEPLTVTGPATSPGTTTTTQNVTNNTTKTETSTHNHTYAGPTINTTTVTVNQTTNNSTGAVTETISTTGTPAPAPDPIKVCGLPDTPACKIDETGTPSGVGTTFDAPKTELETAKTQAQTDISGAQNIAAPTWSFTFALPTGCAPYATGLRGFIMNICPFQPVIHDLLSMIWAASTAFALIGMVGRTIREA